VANRLFVQPVISRRLRAALLFLTLMALLALGETSLPAWGLGLASTMVIMSVIPIWLRLPRSVVPMALSYKPPQLQLVAKDGEIRPCQCVALSVYTWLVILRYRDPQADKASQSEMIVLLPDSLPPDQRQNWRQIMVWAKLMRRAIGAQRH
jgi:hypothetical protein